MRATRQETDLEFWLNRAQEWKQRADDYFIWSAKAAPEEIAWFEAQIDRCKDLQFRAELAYQEARGDIVVYTGRAKPQWAVA